MGNPSQHRSSDQAKDLPRSDSRATSSHNGSPVPPSNEAEIIDLVAEVDASGQEVFVPEDIILRGGILTDAHRAGRSLSVLPNERMAAQTSWEEVAKQLRAAEDGIPRSDVVMAPGGQMEVITEGTARPTSRLPQQRMAAKPYITFSDVDEIRRTDVHNAENWSPVHTAVLDGWRFRLRPLPDGETFVFVAFRSPFESGKWRLWVLRPNMDNNLGHEPHVVTISLSGQEIPVVCGAPGAAPANSLAEARTMAGKWAVYTQRKLLGQDPAFSK